MTYKIASSRTLVAIAILESALCSLPGSAAPTKKRQESPAPAAAMAAPKFTSAEMTLLYDACLRSGGAVSTNGSAFSCTKVNNGQETSANLPQPSSVPAAAKRGGGYTGASTADATLEGATGDISQVHSIEKLLPLIRVGVTTRDQIVAALKEPVSSSFDSTGTETAIFREEVAFWKTGGVGQLFTKRGPVKKTLIVFFKQGRVSYFQSGDQR